MSILPVLLYPHPALRQAAETVTEEGIQSPDLRRFIADMIETMYASTGAVGLAAPQLGSLRRVLVFDTTANTSKSELHVFINPVIVSQSKWKYGKEGCLSIPEFRGTVKRARKITVTWQDIDGQQREGEFLDFAAVVIQHEVDHLHGILFLDRLRTIGAETSLERRQ